MVAGKSKAAMSARIRLLVVPGAAALDWSRRVRDAAAAGPFSVIVPEKDSEEELLRHVPEADAILCYLAPLPGSVIRAGRSLQLIQKHGSNWRNIDVDAATERNIPVATVPLLRSITVAEHAMAIMLACARKIVPGHTAVAQAVYREMGLEPIVTSQREYRANWPGIRDVRELHEATLGIVGMGDIGMEIAKRARPFQMSVCYFDVNRHSASMESMLGIRYLPLDELLSVSDYVVLILPHTPQTEGMIGARELSLMKRSAILINTSRGPLIDEDALAAALAEERIAMAGLDVFRREPLPIESPLRTLPNVVLLPHMGGGSYRFKEVDIPSSLANIERFFAGEGANGIINAVAGGAHVQR